MHISHSDSPCLQYPPLLRSAVLLSPRRGTYPCCLNLYYPASSLLIGLCRTLKDVRSRIPARLLERNTLKSVIYALRSILLSTVFFGLARNIDSTFSYLAVQGVLGPHICALLRCASWVS